jgi:hypothetical protein
MVKFIIKKIFKIEIHYYFLGFYSILNRASKKNTLD